VDHAEHEPDESLKALCQQEQEVNRNGAEDRREQEEQDQHDFLTPDVTEETEREGERTCSVGDKFQRQHKRNEPPEGTAEMLDVACAPALNTDPVVIEEREESQRGVGVHVRR